MNDKNKELEAFKKWILRMTEIYGEAAKRAITKEQGEKVRRHEEALARLVKAGYSPDGAERILEFLGNCAAAGCHGTVDDVIFISGKL